MTGDPYFFGDSRTASFAPPTAFLHLARRLLGGSLGLCFRIAGHLAERPLDGPFDPMSRPFYAILVHIRSPKL
jgi:hypothetical protein